MARAPRWLGQPCTFSGHHAVDFGSGALSAGTFMVALGRLGRTAVRAGNRVVIDDATLTVLYLLYDGSDGTIEAGPDGHPGVRIGAYAYTLWPVSAGPKIATRWQVTP